MLDRISLATLTLCLLLPSFALCEERTEHFDSAPNWDAINNRSNFFSKQKIRQQFGYSKTHNAGGAGAGEMGGIITPAAEAAYYAKVIPGATLNDHLTASGTLACPGEAPTHALIAFFNAQTLNEWRTPNTIAIRILGRGKVFFAFVEYMTSRWHAGGDSPGWLAGGENAKNGKPIVRGFQTNGQIHHWTITYDPKANGGNGSITVTIDDQKAICNITKEHRLDGASFDRFGLLPVMKQWDSPGEIWLDDITVNAEAEDFSTDPAWDSSGNHRTYISENVRPRFDFGFSMTNFAGGAAAGELGGLIFRGDIREPARMACYGDRIENLKLDKPIRASGRIAVRRAVSDSGTLIGFFNSKDSMSKRDTATSGLPASFLGLAVEGPSSTGLLVYPAFRDERDSNGRTTSGPSIAPDGSAHEWKLEYTPRTAVAGAHITVKLDKTSTDLMLPSGETSANTTFDRFGIVSTWIDGNGQNIYFDDLTYTCRQDR